MSEAPKMLSTAGDVFAGVVNGVGEAQLSNSTPCSGYEVRGLLNHLLHWAPFLESGARRQPPPEVEGGERDVDLVEGDWKGSLHARVDSLTDAFAAPGALDGMVDMHGATLAAPMLAHMVLAEWVVHGWDLAMATGQIFECDPAVAASLLVAAQGMVEQGRQFGIFGPEVPVPASAPSLDRVLGLTGRDPAWTP